MREKTRNIVLCGLLVALGVLFGGPLSFNVGTILKVSFAVVPAMFAGLAMGPVYGFVVGFLTDTVTALLFPIGAYMPLFSLTFGIAGALPGLCARFFARLIKKLPDTFLPLIPSVFSGQFLGFTIGNTALIALLYGRGFLALLPTRLMDLLMVPVYAIVIALLLHVYGKVFGRVWVRGKAVQGGDLPKA